MNDNSCLLSLHAHFNFGISLIVSLIFLAEMCGKRELHSHNGCKKGKNAGFGKKNGKAQITTRRELREILFVSLIFLAEIGVHSHNGCKKRKNAGCG